MIKATPITENSFILENDLDEKVGLLIKTDKIKLISVGSGFETFDNIDKLEEKLKDKIKFKKLKKQSEKVETHYINEYPIKHGKDIFNIEQEDKIIKYTVSENSDVKYLAGYWIINNSVNLNPKLSTLTEDSVGPYKSEFDAKADLKILTKE